MNHFPSYLVLHVHPVEIYSQVIKSWIVLQSLGKEVLDDSFHMEYSTVFSTPYLGLPLG